MKLLYQLSSGNVVCRYSEPMDFPVTPSEGYALVDAPASLPIPETIVRVRSEDGELQFDCDDSLSKQLWQGIKEHRNQKLKDSDWSCSVTDYEVPQKAEWVIYRQALRDITQQPNPYRLVWPVEPSRVANPVPALEPASEPSAVPASESSAVPASEPIVVEPASEPASQPVAEPASEPASQPVAEPVSQPSSEPSVEPSVEPSAVPALEPASASA